MLNINKESNAFLKKIIAMMLVITLTITNFLLVATETYAIINPTEENVISTMTDEVETKITNTVEKYFKVEGVGVFLQVALDVNIENSKNKELSNEIIEINMPEVNGYQPITESDGISPYLIDLQSKAESDVSNTESGSTKYEWQKSSEVCIEKITPGFIHVGSTIFKVVYVYPEEAWNGGAETEITWDTTVKMNVDENQNVAKNSEKATISETGNNVDASIEFSPEIFKGQMYNNAEYTTEFDETWKIVTSFVNESASNISIKTKPSKYINEADENINLTKSKVYYKTTSLGMNMLEKVFGEDYSLTIKSLDASGNVIQTKSIDKTTQAKTETNTTIVIEHPDKTTDVEITTSNLLKNVQAFKVKNTKKLITYNTDSLHDLAGIKEVLTVNSNDYENILKIEDAKLNATVSMNKTVLSAVDGKQNIDIAITLVANSEQEDILFDNPSFTLELPEGVSINKINKTTITADGSLTGNARIEDGKIKLDLTGKQTQYTDSEYNPQITINANVEVSKYIANKEDKIKMTYKNAESSNTENTESKEISIISSNEDVMTYLLVSDYDENGSTIEASNLTQTKKVEIAKLDKTEKTVTVKGYLINNNSTDMAAKIVLSATHINENVNDADSRNVLMEETIEETIGAKSVKEITKTFVLPSNLYYNQKIEINLNETFTNNRTTRNASVELYTEPKATGDILVDNDELLIDVATQTGISNLSENDRVAEGATIKYFVTVLNKSNQAKNNVTVMMERLNNNSNFYDLHTETDEAVASSDYYRELDGVTITKNIDTIEANSSKIVEFEVVVRNDSEIRQIKNNITVKEGNTELSTVSTKTLIIEESPLKINLKYFYPENNLYELSVGEESIFVLTVSNLNNEELRDVETSIDLNNSLLYVNDKAVVATEDEEVTLSSKGIIERVNNNIVTYRIKKLAGNESITIKFRVVPNEIEGLTENITLYTTSVYGTKTIYSNIVNKTVYDRRVNVENSVKTKTENGIILENNDKVVNGDKILSYITLKNIGKNPAPAILTIVPNGMDIKEMSINGTKVDIEGALNPYDKSIRTDTFTVGVGREAEIIVTSEIATGLDEAKMLVKTVIDSIDDDKNSNEITLKVVTSQDESDENYVPVDPTANGKAEDGIENDNENTETPSGNDNTQGNTPGTTPNNPNNNENDPEKVDPSLPGNTKYFITGKAWLDKNNNGKIDSNEELLKGITVKLLDSDNNNKFIKNSEGKEIQVTTNDNGEYKFEELDSGKYFVVFEYDTSKYELTTYKQTGITEQYNSDVKDYVIDETVKTTKVAITDEIKLSTNVKDINIGLTNLPIFNLKLDKYITKVITTTSAGKETKTFDGETFVKEEINRNRLVGSNIIVEYTLRITNDGELSGYATDVVDYIPNGMTFNSELNTSWYKGLDGNLYNTSLASTEIKPGEYKDIKLVLTKTITSEDAETIKNNAKIDQYTNIKELLDTNIKDNESSADLMISIATGEIVVEYILVLITTLVIISVGIYFIRKKILV